MQRSTYHLVLRTLLSALFVLAFVGAPAAAEPKTGAQIYQESCAKCHGAKGEGTADHYSEPLIGDRTVSQLASVIAKTMPEDAPGTCTGEDAEKVAAYMHDAFYSPAAQARNKPARIELSRLTVRQYRQSLADLVGSFRSGPSSPLGQEFGLKGEYYKSRRYRRDDRVIERVDKQVNFDFGESSPKPEEIEPREYSIRWEGSVLAPDTGDYEFVIKTENSARLWINDTREGHALIDAWVKSGNDTEFRQSIRLLGGRYYPVKLEFSKSVQGVNQTKEQKEKAPIGKGSIVLLWKLPQRVEEVIPDRNLVPQEVPESFVVQTPFPPDDRSVGYERGTSISKAWDEATTDGAIETAAYVASRLRELSGVPSDASDRSDRLKAFCRQFVETAFRRVLTDEERELYVDRHFTETSDLDASVKRVVLLTLKSPRFLYREIGSKADGYDVASRLSFALWDSLPDKQLLDAAASGQLATREQIAAQAERMLNDIRTKSKVRDFFLQWLKVDQIPDISKDPQSFPEFDKAVATDLRTSLDLFLEDIVWNGNGDFRQLVLSDSLYLNGRLAKIYGGQMPADAGFQKTALQPEARAGVLTHPYLMASFAYTSTTSPIHRGVFIARSLLGRSLKPPPEAVSPLPPELHADLTTRERTILQTKSESCQTCHTMINPLGFTLEHFDAVGRYREQEKGRPVDTSGEYHTRSGEVAKFAGVRDLANFLANSDEAHAAFVEQLFHYSIKQPIQAFGSDRSTDLQQYFRKNEFNIRKLLAEIALASALRDQGKPSS